MNEKFKRNRKTRDDNKRNYKMIKFLNLSVMWLERVVKEQIIMNSNQQ